MIRVRAIDHIVLRVADVDRVAAFYIDVLGAAWERRRPDIGLHHLRIGDALIDLVAVDSKLGRMRAGAPDPDRPNLDHVALRVDPWDEPAILAFLHSKGITAEVDDRFGAGGDGPSLYLTDPEGNGVELKGYPAAD